MISNRRYEVDRSNAGEADALLRLIESSFGEPALRWFISEADRNRVVIESTEYGGNLPGPPIQPPRTRSGLATVISLIPTGIGCAIGGYAGDAAPVTALLAQAADLVVTNPNALNASNFVRTSERILYTEGSCIDSFARGQINLHRSRGNRVGLIIESSATAAVEHVWNVTNAVRAVHGIDVVDYVVTERPIGTRCVRNESGAYVGCIDSPDVLLEAAQSLIDRGSNAIAVTTNVQDLTSQNYSAHFSGSHANPVGGAEAVLSHLIVRVLGVPAAHAPMMNFKDLMLDHSVVDARSAGELVSVSGLACVLIALGSAPQISPEARGARLTDEVSIDDVIAVVAPADALGGVPVLEALRRRVPVLAVRENTTILDVTADALDLPGVSEVANYTEAAGLVLALRGGISPETLTRPLRTLGLSASEPAG
ncbi:DUF3326 domain-containing protein [Streptomyces sp. BA2]|uniref:DUF3326 domain-containing protein n=1 Tax=Streptomyces sp. BA2 TaxID=436595 RepID=UPI0013231B65|nr:DUF3326 domain-containing protein [Streptomyces sp. BA2]MWA08353.1 DUF3326 domain-containing protein [Streptomyces sp. BA2]